VALVLAGNLLVLLRGRAAFRLFKSPARKTAALETP
jgi:hypothetical protein